MMDAPVHKDALPSTRELIHRYRITPTLRAREQLGAEIHKLQKKNAAVFEEVKKDVKEEDIRRAFYRGRFFFGSVEQWSTWGGDALARPFFFQGYGNSFSCMQFLFGGTRTAA